MISLLLTLIAIDIAIGLANFCVLLANGQQARATHALVKVVDLALRVREVKAQVEATGSLTGQDSTGTYHVADAMKVGDGRKALRKRLAYHRQKAKVN